MCTKQILPFTSLLGKGSGSGGSIGISVGIFVGLGSIGARLGDRDVGHVDGGIKFLASHANLENP